jgi:DMSO/TMAO reductase YedYZ heme-binding membrane subunit
MRRMAKSASPWRLFGILAAATVAVSAALLAAYGVGEEGARVWIRATARIAAGLFLLTFVARPLRALWRSDASGWLLANRRYLGASAAFAQLVHLVAILHLFARFPGTYDADPVTLAGGGLGFALFFAMGLTSNDAAVAKLGRARWKLLHRVGAWWIWFVFALTFLGNVATVPAYAAVVALFVAALGLRVAAWAKSRAREPAAA